MTFQAGFSEVDIAPPYYPIRTYLGTADQALDPLYVKAAAFRGGDQTVVFLSYDLVIIEWEYVQRIRAGLADAGKIPTMHILVCATHNHACPAVVDRPGHMKEHKYIDFFIERGIQAGLTALERLEPAELGLGRGLETRVSFNRRFIMQDGTVISEPESMENILCNEGVIDPGLTVIAARRPGGRRLGLMVNFACHAVHHIGEISAGFPGVIADRIRRECGADVPCLFLNGASGNIMHDDYTDPAKDVSMERTGGILADDVVRILPDIAYARPTSLAVSEESIKLGYRGEAALQEMTENIDNPEYYVNILTAIQKKGWYHYSLERLREMTAQSDGIEVVIQVIRLGEIFFAAIPAEYFTEHGLRIKEQSPARTCVVSLANGWLGYIPTREAFRRRGGHETSLAFWSKMEPAAGDRMADLALEQIRSLHR